MPTNLPSGLDVFTDPTTTSPQNNPSHAGLHIASNDALAAVEQSTVSDGPASITNILGQTIPDFAATGTLITLSGGVTRLTRIWLRQGITITNIWFQNASTASTVATHFWAGLLDHTPVSPVLLANSADTLGTVNTVANTPTKFVLTSPFTTTYAGYYYIFPVITATQYPTIDAGAPITANSGRLTQTPIPSGPGMTSVTTVASYTQAGSIVPSAYGAPLLGYVN